MKTINRTFFFPDLLIKNKLVMAIVIATLVFFATPGFSQTPELFEDKVLLNNISAPWGFTFINDNEVLFTEKRGKVYRYIISTNSLT